MSHSHLLNLLKISNIYLQPAAEQINVWLKGILNFFQSRKKWAKKLLLLAVERVQIVVFLMERLSERQIAKRLQCSKSSVHRALKKFKKHAIYDDMKKTGRPRKPSCDLNYLCKMLLF